MGRSPGLSRNRVACEPISGATGGPPRGIFVTTLPRRFSAELYRLFEFEQDSPLTIERIAARVHPEDIALLQEKIERARNNRLEAA
jgi:hypothetical protein